MKFKQFCHRYVVRIDKGEEIVQSLKCFCEEQKIKLGWVSAIGATNRVTIGCLETNTKKYHQNELTGDYEITSLMGNISQKEGEVYLHLHINVADKKSHVFGGHLNEAWISGTCEMTVDVSEGVIEREYNEEVGLNLYKI